MTLFIDFPMGNDEFFFPRRNRLGSSSTGLFFNCTSMFGRDHHWEHHSFSKNRLGFCWSYYNLAKCHTFCGKLNPQNPFRSWSYQRLKISWELKKATQEAMVLGISMKKRELSENFRFKILVFNWALIKNPLWHSIESWLVNRDP